MTGNSFLVYQNTTLFIEVQDHAGNSTGTSVIIDNIDSTVPVCSVSYVPTERTNQDVVASLTGCNKPIIIHSGTVAPCAGGAYEVSQGACTFTGNGSFMFRYQDDIGHTGTTLATVSRIDKEPPQVLRITYSPSSSTEGPVVATIVLDETGTVV
jgi:hypothetical protein